MTVTPLSKPQTSAQSIDEKSLSLDARPDSLGRFGRFGGKYVPETLMPALRELEDAFYNWEDQKKTNTEGYGYGWNIRFEDDIKVLSHYGETTGFASQVNRVPSLQLTAVLFSNYIGADRNLMHKVNALTSIYSNYKIPMPIDIMMKKAIDEKGLAEGLKTYDVLKNDVRYKYELTSLSFLAASFYRMDRKAEAEGIYRKAVAEQPDYFGGYFGLARVQRDKGLEEEAIANY